MRRLRGLDRTEGAPEGPERAVGSEAVGSDPADHGGSGSLEEADRLLQQASDHLLQVHQILNALARLHLTESEHGRLKMRAFRAIGPAAAAARATVPAVDEIRALIREELDGSGDPEEQSTLTLFES